MVHENTFYHPHTRVPFIKSRQISCTIQIQIIMTCELMKRHQRDLEVDGYLYFRT